MDISFLILTAALVLAAALVAFALLRKPARVQGEAEAAGRLMQAVEALAARVEGLDNRVGASLDGTGQTLGGISARLTVIDEAQKNITALSGHVVSLQEVLSNKQSRGAFGQAQMEDIVRDGLPARLYEFQATLSNKSRPDCLIKLPGASAAIVIDSKFPLECFTAVRDARTEEERKAAAARVRGDMLKHVSDIAEKYLIPGETQTPAIMFVPSELIYAELHDGFSDVIQRAHRAQVIVVSPNILMLAINTMQTVMKDARMREQAGLIQKEVGALVQDVRRLGERVGKLQTHFNQAEGDLKDITVSTDKIVKRGTSIESVELQGPDGEKPRLADR